MLYRNIQTQLVMEPEERERCQPFIVACKAEYERLLRQQLPFPKFVLRRYLRKFSDVHHKPEVVNVAVEEVTSEAGGRTASTIHEAVHHATTRPGRRDRRASTLLQDHIIDPGKAMRQAVPEIVVHGAHAHAHAGEEGDGPPAGISVAGQGPHAPALPHGPVYSPPDLEPPTPSRPRKLSGMLPRIGRAG